MSLIEQYVNLEWSIFPVVYGTKTPFKNTNGLKEATNNIYEARTLFSRHNQYNIGVATGKGFFVLDVDVKKTDGISALESLKKKYGAFPETVTSITPSGGFHYYFLTPTNIQIRNSQGLVGEGLDIRGIGGYVLVPDSFVAGYYRWAPGLSPFNIDMAPCPEWIINIILSKNKKENNPHEEFFPIGTQDESLLKLTCALINKNIPHDIVEETLNHLLTKIPQDLSDKFSKKDIKRWIESASKYRKKTTNALIIAEELIKNHSIINVNEIGILQYKDGYYQKISENSVIKYITDACGCLSITKINLIIKYIKSLTEIPLKDVNNYDALINLENGVLDLENTELNPHSSHFLMTTRFPVRYNESEKRPLWDAFLKEIFQDESSINIVQEFFGLCLTRETFNKSLFLVGEGKNGKSTFLNTIKAILGNENTCELNLEMLDKGFYIAHLHNKLLNICSEINTGHSISDDIFKKIVTQDYIMGDHKFGNPFSFKPSCKLVFATNTMPRVSDKSHAFFRRVIIINMTRVFDDNEEIHDYSSRLLEEKTGILNWMIEGLKRLKLNKKFSVNQQIERNVYLYKLENNPVLGFVTEFCIFDNCSGTLKNIIYNAYKKYCIDYGFIPLNIRKFIKELKRISPKNELDDKRNDQGRLLHGIRLKEDFGHILEDL
jgi:P4 family phage/plasmid primase-like protien